MTGYISKFESMGAADGPGVRTVVFMQGCPLRCVCCHNPETWDIKNGEAIEPADILKFIMRYKNYYGKNGGVTFSGGEPLLQAEFLKECLKLCKEKGIHTAIDTSGCILTPAVCEALEHTDLVILDIKMTTEADYQKYTGGSLEKTLQFLNKLQELNKDVWIRQVIIPGLNDNQDNIKRLNNICRGFSCIKKAELLPFKKLCITKYNNLNIGFPLADIPECDENTIENLDKLLKI